MYNQLTTFVLKSNPNNGKLEEILEKYIQHASNSKLKKVNTLPTINGQQLTFEEITSNLDHQLALLNELSHHILAVSYKLLNICEHLLYDFNNFLHQRNQKPNLNELVEEVKKLKKSYPVIENSINRLFNWLEPNIICKSNSPLCLNLLAIAENIDYVMSVEIEQNSENEYNYVLIYKVIVHYKELMTELIYYISLHEALPEDSDIVKNGLAFIEAIFDISSWFLSSLNIDSTYKYQVALEESAVELEKAIKELNKNLQSKL